MVAILVFILILSVLVLLHELGHFIMAKRAGIGVEEFGFGIPPRLWGKKIRGTIYSVNWLPFGGFVRLVGEDPLDKHIKQKNSFYTKTLSQRASVVLAGVVVNFILAVVLFYIVLFALGFKASLPLIVEHKFKFVNQSKQVLVVDVASQSSADSAGIKLGDSILAINNQKINSIDQLQTIVRASQDENLVLLIENPVNNKVRTVNAKPAYSEELKAPALGIGLGELVVLNYQTLGQKLYSGFIHSYNTVEYSLKVFSQLIGYAISQKDIRPVSEGVSGPVGIASITSQAVAMGPLTVLQLVALLSLNLALINVLPIPALDGGRFLFIFIELITRHRVNPAFEKWAHTIGFGLLIALIFLITYNDIIKLVR